MSYCLYKSIIPSKKLEIMDKNFLVHLFLLFLAILNIDNQGYSQSFHDSLDTQLSALYDEGKFPAFCLGIINEEGTIYQKGFGMSDISKSVAYTEETVQPIASISKVFIGVAVMKAIELGYFDLETNINDLLPFKVVNPHFPDAQIKVKHLVTHTSGILDRTMVYLKSYYLLEDINFKDYNYGLMNRILLKKANKNDSLSLGAFLKEVISKEGSYYKTKTFNKSIPGAEYHYSNMAAALAAYLVEHTSGISFGDFTKKYIFEPLEMNSTSWKILNHQTVQNAVLYDNKNTPFPQYSLNTYPDGGLRTNVSDISKFLIEMINGYHGKGFLLTQQSFQTMFAPQHTANNLFKEHKYEKSGVFWELTNTGAIGHNGSDPGVTTFMYFRPDKRFGIVLFFNSEFEGDKRKIEYVGKIWKIAVEYALRHCQI